MYISTYLDYMKIKDGLLFAQHNIKMLRIYKIKNFLKMLNKK